MSDYVWFFCLTCGVLSVVYYDIVWFVCCLFFVFVLVCACAFYVCVLCLGMDRVMLYGVVILGGVVFECCCLL